MYGTLLMNGRPFVVIVDRPDGADSKLYVDSNGNGNLTDDPPVIWTKHAYKARNGTDLTECSGYALVTFGFGGGRVPASLGMYLFDKNDPERAALKDTL